MYTIKHPSPRFSIKRAVTLLAFISSYNTFSSESNHAALDWSHTHPSDSQPNTLPTSTLPGFLKTKSWKAPSSCSRFRLHWSSKLCLHRYHHRGSIFQPTLPRALHFRSKRRQPGAKLHWAILLHPCPYGYLRELWPKTLISICLLTCRRKAKSFIIRISHMEAWKP